MGLMKILPVVAFLGAGYKTNDNVKVKVDRILNYVKTVAVQYEVNQLSQIVYMDTIDNTQPESSEFTQYIKRNMAKKVNAKRDGTKDYWNQLYRLKYFDQPRKFLVISPGPDQKLNSDDDVSGGFFY